MQFIADQFIHHHPAIVDHRQPFTLRVVMNVRWITQHFDRLQPDVEHCFARRRDIHQDKTAARFEDAANLHQRRLNIMPVVRRVAADNNIKAVIRERQNFRRTLCTADITHPALLGFLFHNFQHPFGQIIRGDLSDQRRGGKAGMPGTTADVQQACLRIIDQPFGQTT